MNTVMASFNTVYGTNDRNVSAKKETQPHSAFHKPRHCRWNYTLLRDDALYEYENALPRLFFIELAIKRYSIEKCARNDRVIGSFQHTPDMLLRARGSVLASATKDCHEHFAVSFAAVCPLKAFKPTIHSFAYPLKPALFLT